MIYCYDIWSILISEIMLVVSNRSDLNTHILFSQWWSRIAGWSDWSRLCRGWNSMRSVYDVSGQEVPPYSVSEPELLSHWTQRTHLFQSRGETNLTAHTECWGVEVCSVILSIQYSLYWESNAWEIINIFSIFGHSELKQVCNNEATCTCDTTWAGTDCSMPDPPKEPPPAEDEGPKGLLHWYKHIQRQWSLVIKHQQKRFQCKSWLNLWLFWMDVWLIYTEIHE